MQGVFSVSEKGRFQSRMAGVHSPALCTLAVHRENKPAVSPQKQGMWDKK